MLLKHLFGDLVTLWPRSLSLTTKISTLIYEQLKLMVSSASRQVVLLQLLVEVYSAHMNAVH